MPRTFTDPDQLDVSVHEPFVVELSGNGVGGYVWQLAAPPDGIRVLSDRDVPPREPGVGAGGTKEFQLEAAGPGEYAVAFELRRDWEPEAERVRTVTVRASD